MSFLQSLKDYDKDDISPDIMKKIRKDFIPHKDFQPHIVAKASSAAEGLCKWIKAIENFESVNTIVRPKKIKLMKAKENLKETRKFLAEKRALAVELEEKVDGLHAELEKTNVEKQRTEKEVEMCERKLEQAEALISSLGEEKNHWTQKAAHLQELLDNLPGDILLSCGLIAYLGILPQTNRENCIKNWHNYCQTHEILCSSEFNVISCLGDEIEIQDWHVNGLANDELSIGNNIIISNSFRQCLLIDPQLQANKWIRQMEKRNHLQVVKQSDCTYFEIIIKCMELGHPILIEDINQPLDISLEEIFNYRISMENHLLRLNSNLCIHVSDSFRLYVTSNVKNVSFLCGISGKLNIINYVFMANGLEENLLDTLVLKENPYLREERDQLTELKLRDKALIKQYEIAILSSIAECDGDILEDAEAIKKMDDSKQHYSEILAKQSIYVEDEHKIHIYREGYRDVASYASILYSCLDHLQNVNPMYEFSLDWYLNLYNNSIENANRSQDLNRRIDFLKRSIGKHFYNSVCRSIFDKDKLLFSWIITTKILLANNRLRPDQLHTFISSDIEFIGPSQQKPNIQWITDQMWIELNALSQILLDYDEFLDSFQVYANEWNLYFEDKQNGMPIELQNRLSSFEKLLLSKIVHPEHLIELITEFIRQEIGEQFLTPPQFDIHRSYDESNILTPLIFLLTPGVDPIDNVFEFAKRKGYLQSLQIISLGDYQGNYIDNTIAKAQKLGSWVCIQNCHLNTDWLSNLERTWKNMNIHNTDRELI